jgi:hypothetical protein
MTVPQVIDEFLTSNTRTMLVTLRRDGSPTVHPMVGLWRDGALWLNAYGRSAKVRNLERDPRVCCVVLGGVDELGPPAVVVRGDAEVMPPGTALPGGPIADANVRRPRGVSPGIVTKVADRVATSKRILVRVMPRDLRMLD